MGGTIGLRSVLFSARIELSGCGEVPERSNGAVSKTVVPLTGDRGFESLPLRHSPISGRLVMSPEASDPYQGPHASKPHTWPLDTRFRGHDENG